MANQKKDNFLGGTPRFNKVGAGVPGGASDSAHDETPLPPITLVKSSQGQTRTIAVVIALLVLIGVLYFVSEVGLGGIQHTEGQGNRSAPPVLGPPPPPKNF